MLVSVFVVQRDALLDELAAIEAGEKAVSFDEHRKMLIRLEALNRLIAELQAHDC